MKKIKIKVIDFDTISADLNNPLPKNLLFEWINGGREDILDNPDIFFENVRSVDKTYKNFEFFERVDIVDASTILVFSIYLELFEYHSRNFIKCIDFYSKKYPNNKIIFYWNHDIDFARYNTIVEKYHNVYILNYNTSSESKNDIILPFWTFSNNDRFIDSEKIYLCNFLGTYNHPIRINLLNCFKDKPGYLINKRLDYSTFVDVISKSKYTFCPRGQGLSSYRFFESMFYGSVPVLLADDVILPYCDVLNYDDFIIRVPESKSSDFDYINHLLLSDNFEKRKKKLIESLVYFRLDGLQQYVYDKLNS